MIITRKWDSRTFSIPPINEIIHRYVDGLQTIIDPFSCGCRIGTITNDLNPECDADFHMDALDFLKILEDQSADAVLYDPPYSSRQVAECYKKLDKTVNMQTTQGSSWAKQKKEIERIVKPGGICITCGWNSGGIGKKYGFESIEILLVAHGGWHNDTIVTVEKRIGGTK